MPRPANCSRCGGSRRADVAGGATDPVLASILRRHVSRTARRGVVACLIVIVLAVVRFAVATTIPGRVYAIAGGVAAIVLFVVFVAVARRKHPGLDELIAQPGSITRVERGPRL